MRCMRAPLARTVRAAVAPSPFSPVSQYFRNFRPTFLSLRPIPPSIQIRTHASTTAVPPQPLPHRPAPHRNPNEPIYELTFTCKICKERSAHTVSKQGYHKGTVLISCPGCKNRHLISDHLHIFSDSKITIEDILKEKGENVQRGTIDAQGDIEFWTDQESEQNKSKVEKQDEQD